MRLTSAALRLKRAPRSKAPDEDEPDVVAMLVALGNGGSYPPPGITDTPRARKAWDRIAADLDAMARDGISPQVPYEHHGEG